jgi:four helix bundle protein
MDKAELEKRTKQFALKVIEFVATLPQTRTGAVIEYQLVKAGTSVGANYREANRAESRADFIHKIAIVEKECSESGFGLRSALRPIWETLTFANGYCESPENYWPFSRASAGAPKRTAPVRSGRY